VRRLKKRSFFSEINESRGIPELHVTFDGDAVYAIER